MVEEGADVMAEEGVDTMIEEGIDALVEEITDAMVEQGIHNPHHQQLQYHYKLLHSLKHISDPKSVFLYAIHQMVRCHRAFQLHS